ncbi:amino acid ABC transporter substrate-binding protein [Clostridium sp.]|uniref:amino acid ABC transporter substrate-binding protein n=1 Tax=Clostridium sp. TaxID=1506 RepID=UPI002FC80666
MKNKFFSIAVIAIILLAAISFVGCTSKVSDNGKVFSTVEERGYVVVGIDDTFAPMGFKNDKNEIVGFDVDLANEVFKRLGLSVEFQVIDWSMKETELNSGNIDVIWNGYTITNERKEKVAFTKPYLENKQLIIALSSSKIETKEDIKEKSVAAQNESSSVDAMNKEPEIVNSLKGGQPLTFDNNNEIFMELESGRIDAVVVDEILARYYMRERGINKYKVLEDNFGNEEYGVGVRKKDVELLEKIDKTLEEMKVDGTCEEISKKWFEVNLVK